MSNEFSNSDTFTAADADTFGDSDMSVQDNDKKKGKQGGGKNKKVERNNLDEETGILDESPAESMSSVKSEGREGENEPLKDNVGMENTDDKGLELEADIVGQRRTQSVWQQAFSTVDDSRLSIKVAVEKSDVKDQTRFTRVKYHILTYWDRLQTLRIFEIKLLHWEYEELCGQDGLFIAAAQALCWRRTVLEIASFFQFFSFFFAVSRLLRAALGDIEDYGDGKIFGMDLGDYATYFKGYVALEYVFKSAIVGAQFIAFVFAVLSAYYWRDFPKSGKCSAYAYAIVYFMPFIMWLFTPFQDGVDIRGIQQQFCRDVINGAGNLDVNITGLDSWGPQKMINTLSSNAKLLGAGKAAGLNIGLNSSAGLRAMLYEQYGAVLPEDFCDLDPQTWVESVENALKSTGRLIEGGAQTCTAVNLSTGTGTLLPDAATVTTGAVSMAESLASSSASQFPDLTQDLAAAKAKCESGTCSACGSATCLPLLPTLQTSAALSMNSARAEALKTSNPPTSQQTMQEALTALGLDSSSSISSCTSCFNELQGVAASATSGQVPSCASLCMPLWAAGDATFSGSGALASDYVQRLNASFTTATTAALFAAEAGNTAEVVKLCVKAEDLDLVEALLTLAVSTRPWKLLLGMRLAMRALGTLLPCNFAMMLGSFKGAGVAKTIVPYSRVPGLIILSAVVFSLPHLLTLLLIVKIIVGDWFFTWTIVCFLASIMVYLPWNVITGSRKMGGGSLMEPGTHAEATGNMEKRQKYALVCQIMMLTFLCLYGLLSEHLSDFVQMGVFEVDFSKVRATIESADFWSFIGWTCVDMFCRFFGMTKIASVFFCDMCLAAILVIDEEDTSPVDAEFRKLHEEKEHYLFVELHKALQPKYRRALRASGVDPHKSKGEGLKDLTDIFSTKKYGEKWVKVAKNKAIRDKE